MTSGSLHANFHLGTLSMNIRLVAKLELNIQFKKSIKVVLICGGVCNNLPEINTNDVQNKYPSICSTREGRRFRLADEVCKIWECRYFDKTSLGNNMLLYRHCKFQRV